MNTIHNKLCEVFEKYPELKESTNDDVVEAYREMHDREGERTPSESITRAWRHLKSLGFYRGNITTQEGKYKKEEQFRKHYGKPEEGL